MKFYLFYISLFICCFITSCNSSKSVSTTASELNGSYHIVTLLKENVIDKSMTISFDAATHIASGKSACNTYSCSYSNDKNVISFTTQTTTKRYCPDTMKYEQSFLSSLSEVTAMEVNSDIISFKNSNDIIIITAKKTH